MNYDNIIKNINKSIISSDPNSKISNQYEFKVDILANAKHLKVKLQN